MQEIDTKYYLEARDIVKKYGDFTALNGVNIKVSKGFIYGLLGPNGAGKSSLIRIINRIAIQDEGEILFLGKKSTSEDVFKIGYLPEERGLYKKMKVGEHIIFLARLKGLSKAEAKKQMSYWLNKFSISDWENKKIEELSKGMAQKVQFIACVIHNPDLLILDEPFSGFDPVNSELLRKEILEFKEQGKTIILSTHNMESVETLCDEISLINKSKVMLQGSVSDIRQEYKKHIFKVTLAGIVEDFNINNFDTISTNVKNNETTFRIQKKGDSQISNSELIKQIAPNYEIISFEEELPSMSDIFIQIVSENQLNIND